MATQPELIIEDTGATELVDCELRIEQAERDAYLVRGRELATIRDKKLWAKRYNHASFEEYCQERWELTDRYARNLIDASAFGELAKRNNCSVPAREAHIRPLLARLEFADDQLAVWRDVLDTTNGEKIRTQHVEDAIGRFLALRNKEYVRLDEWHDLDEGARSTLLNRTGKKHRLNEQKNSDIEWADWSWNPVTGCLHGCPYCYARDIAMRTYPEDVGFGAALWPDRLTAPGNHPVPPDADDGEHIARKNIFACSMADLFGRWVPDAWIERVLAEAATHPEWNFLFLTKFPKRMAEFAIPENAWLGTTVDVQARVANAEAAFSRIKAPIRWLSLEPMLEPLQFTRLDLFDWIVIGGASPSKAVDGSPETPAWEVPLDWIADLYAKARDAGCRVYFKTNSGLRGKTRLREFPGSEPPENKAPRVFDYLRAIPRDERIG